jgi:1-phosphatidylinositol phosphodiesterase
VGDLGVRFDAARWMSTIPDAVSLGVVTIPGTHQSCARYSGPTMGFMKCQNVSFDVAAQLATGVRYLDVRCCLRRGSLRLHHDFVYQRGTIDDVLVPCALFLRENAGEVVVMRVRQEYSTAADGEFRCRFEERVATLGLTGLCYALPMVPSLGQVRGKVVLVTGPSYVGGLRWGDDAVMDVQDAWTVTSRSSKLRLVVAHVERAMRRQPGDDAPERLFINHASGFRVPWLTPRAVATYVNPRVGAAIRELADQVSARREASGLGIVVMDFVDEAAELLELLIGWNFREVASRTR